MPSHFSRIPRKMGFGKKRAAPGVGQAARRIQGKQDGPLSLRSPC